ncbi:MAG: arsenosugar biosynthesis radical SAM protein ArsS [Syntrophales bacterium]|nr:arsenosugar biosynthesis radical SAM protein ArsS [Syntrophales bacterium]
MNLPDHSPSFAQKLSKPLMAEGIEIFQINIGYRCNLECRHCHIKAGPLRSEMMSKPLMGKCLQIQGSHTIPTVDITGGSPEMHPHFRWFLEECAALKRRLLVRTNGVILLEAEFASFIDLYARHQVEVVVSLPNVDGKTTDRQRGDGVFTAIIEAISNLNARGYGKPDSGLILNLVHNPGGAYTPGSQVSMEKHYRRVLSERYGVCFNHLLCITNMPIGRYLHYLLRTDNYDDYMAALAGSFNEVALEGVMCRTTLSVAWDGTLYDCDFNQALGLAVNHGAPDHISAFDLSKLIHRRIVTGDHCYGCTAGAGSSCRGEVA